MNKVPLILIAICLMAGLLSTSGCITIPTGGGGTPPTPSTQVIADNTLTIACGQSQSIDFDVGTSGQLKGTIKVIGGTPISCYLYEKPYYYNVTEALGVMQYSPDVSLLTGEYSLRIYSTDCSVGVDESLVSIHLEVES